MPAQPKALNHAVKPQFIPVAISKIATQKQHVPVPVKVKEKKHPISTPGTQGLPSRPPGYRTHKNTHPFIPLVHVQFK